jgi:hypothetical protein
MRARLVWYTRIGSRSKTAMASLGVLEGYADYLVRDDYAGWHQSTPSSPGSSNAQHLIRHASEQALTGNPWLPTPATA